MPIVAQTLATTTANAIMPYLVAQSGIIGQQVINQTIIGQSQEIANMVQIAHRQAIMSMVQTVSRQETVSMVKTISRKEIAIKKQIEANVKLQVVRMQPYKAIPTYAAATATLHVHARLLHHTLQHQIALQPQEAHHHRIVLPQVTITAISTQVVAEEMQVAIMADHMAVMRADVEVADNRM